MRTRRFRLALLLVGLLGLSAFGCAAPSFSLSDLTLPDPIQNIIDRIQEMRDAEDEYLDDEFWDDEDYEDEYDDEYSDEDEDYEDFENYDDYDEEEYDDGFEEGEDFDGENLIQDFGRGLDQLDRYRLSLSVSLSGKDEEEKEISQRFDYQEEVQQDTGFSKIKLSTSGISQSGKTEEEFYLVDNKAFRYQPSTKGGSCEIITAETLEEAVASFNPASIFYEIAPGALIRGGETLDKIQTDHSRVEFTTLSLGTIEREDSEIWIAQEGGYIARFSGQGEGEFGLTPDAFISGALRWDYSLRPLEKPITASLPSACQKQIEALNNLPLPEGVDEIIRLGDYASFLYSSDPVDMYDLYLIVVQTKGWRVTRQIEDDPIYRMTIRKDERELEITISPDGQGGSAVIIIGQW